MKPAQADANRKPGHKFDRRFDGYLPPEGVALATVRIVFRVLFRHQKTGPGVGEAFGPVASAWADRGGLSISPECQRLGDEFVKKYLLVDNPTLVPVLLDDYYCQAIAAERGADWTSFRVDTLSRNPSPLGRPTDRRGRQYYAGALRKTSAQGDRHVAGHIDVPRVVDPGGDVDRARPALIFADVDDLSAQIPVLAGRAAHIGTMLTS